MVVSCPEQYCACDSVTLLGDKDQSFLVAAAVTVLVTAVPAGSGIVLPWERTGGSPALFGASLEAYTHSPYTHPPPGPLLAAGWTDGVARGCLFPSWLAAVQTWFIAHTICSGIPTIPGTWCLWRSTEAFVEISFSAKSAQVYQPFQELCVVTSWGGTTRVRKSLDGKRFESWGGSSLPWKERKIFVRLDRTEYLLSRALSSLLQFY